MRLQRWLGSIAGPCLPDPGAGFPLRLTVPEETLQEECRVQVSGSVWDKAENRVKGAGWQLVPQPSRDHG